MAITEEQAIAMLGERMGRWLHSRAMGIDDRAVKADRERKSLSLERTFSVDLSEIDAIEAKLDTLCVSLFENLQRKDVWGRTWNLKVKYSDFETVTRSITAEIPRNSGSGALFTLLKPLVAKTEAGRRPIRLLGVGCSNLCDQKDLTPTRSQLRLLDC